MKNNIDEILNRYPKKRIELNDKIKKIYKAYYLYSRSNRGVVKKTFMKFTNWMHLNVASGGYVNKILEMGAGNLNHVEFEKFEKYDVIEPSLFLYNTSENKSLISNHYINLTKLDEEQYDKIVSVATLEHLINLSYDIAKLSILLKENGSFKHAIPTEGSVLWYLSSRYISGLNFFIRHRLNFDNLLRYEHVNTAYEIEEIIKYFFEDVKIKRFPFNLRQLSIFTYIEAKNPKKKLASEFLNNYKCEYIEEDFDINENLE